MPGGREGRYGLPPGHRPGPGAAADCGEEVARLREEGARREVRRDGS